MVERLPGNKHVSGWATGEGGVIFLNNHNHVPNVAAHEVNTEVGELFHPSLADLDGAPF